MPLREIGAVLLVLVAVLIVGNLWFHLVEGLLNRIRGLFARREDLAPWHPLPPEEEDSRDD